MGKLIVQVAGFDPIQPVAERTPDQRKPLPGGRKKLTPYEMGRMKKALYKEQGGLCRKCRRPIPLKTLTDQEVGTIVRMGAETNHITPKRMGGGSREDGKQNLELLCNKCHSAVHVPPKVVPRKR